MPTWLPSYSVGALKAALYRNPSKLVKTAYLVTRSYSGAGFRVFVTIVTYSVETIDFIGVSAIPSNQVGKLLKYEIKS